MKHYRCFGSLCWNHISIFGLPICSSQSLLPEHVHRRSISCICACAGFCFLAFDGQSCNMQLPSKTGKTQPTLEYLECHLKVKALCNCNSLGFCLARRMCVCVGVFFGCVLCLIFGVVICNAPHAFSFATALS